MQITTRRFLLRDFVAEDEAAFVAYHGDPRYAEFCSPEEVAPEHARQLMSRFMQWAGERPRRNYQLAITRLEDPHELLGCCGLRCENYPAGQAELGIELAPQYWGRYRYAIEAAGALLDFGFRDLELQEVRGITVSANQRVTRLAQRYGFVVAGTRSESGWSHTEWQLTRAQWERLSMVTIN